jgi:hypothetical protein
MKRHPSLLTVIPGVRVVAMNLSPVFEAHVDRKPNWPRASCDKPRNRIEYGLSIQT